MGLELKSARELPRTGSVRKSPPCFLAQGEDVMSGTAVLGSPAERMKQRSRMKGSMLRMAEERNGNTWIFNDIIVPQSSVIPETSSLLSETIIMFFFFF